MENEPSICNVNRQKIIKVFPIFTRKAIATDTLGRGLYLTASKILVKFLIFNSKEDTIYIYIYIWYPLSMIPMFQDP